MALKYSDTPDDEAAAELLNRLRKKNYIPDRAKKNYAKALLREFKKSLGKPCEEEALTGVEIKVLGQGCVQCNRLEKELMEVLILTIAGKLMMVCLVFIFRRKKM